jgi:tetratricopeptide (TPR) repeat protein
MKSAIEWNNEGLKYYEKKQFESAAQAFQKALELDNSNAIFWKNMGDCLYDMQKKEEAIRYYEKAITLDRNTNPSIYLDYGIVLFSEKQYSKALKQLLQAESHPNLTGDFVPEVSIWLSDTYYELAEYSQALRQLKKKVKTMSNCKKNPADVERFFKIYVAMNDFRQALSELEQGIGLYPENQPLLFLLLDFFKERYLYGSIQSLLSANQEFYQSNIDLWTKLLAIRIYYEDYDRIEEDCDQLLLKTKDHEVIEFIREIKERTIANRADLHKVIEEPFNAEQYQILEENYFLKKAIGHFLYRQFIKAHDFLVRYLKKQPLSQGGIILMGILKIFVMDYDRAEKLLNYYSTLDSEFPLPFLGLAYCAFCKNNFDQMLQAWTILCEKFPFWTAFDPHVHFANKVVLNDIFGNTMAFVQALVDKKN